MDLVYDDSDVCVLCPRWLWMSIDVSIINLDVYGSHLWWLRLLIVSRLNLDAYELHLWWIWNSMNYCVCDDFRCLWIVFMMNVYMSVDCVLCWIWMSMDSVYDDFRCLWILSMMTLDFYCLCLWWLQMSMDCDYNDFRCQWIMFMGCVYNAFRCH
jgi:hypothetical protein